MLKHNGGERVGKGTYWNFDNGERVDIAEEGMLPGGNNDVYYRLPASGILVAGPFLGLVYAAFLPFIGIAMVVKLLGQKMAGSLVDAMRTTPSFSFRPSESYLAGRKREKKEEEKKEEEPGKEDDA